jgi:adenylate cyclase
MQDTAKRVVLSPAYPALALGLLLSALCLFWPDPFESLDSRIYDLKMRYSDADPLKKSIVHLDVDDKSILKLGPWPWDRGLSARIVNRLSDAGVALIVFDIIFTTQGKSPQGDNAFFQALSSSDRVVSATGLGTTDNTYMKDAIDRARADALYKRAWPVRLPESNKYLKVAKLSDALVPLPPILENSKAVGHIKSTADPDGVQRKVALLMKYEDKCVPSLSLAALAAYLNVGPKDVTVTDSGEITLKHASGVLTIPVDQRGQMLIRWQTRREGSDGDSRRHKPWQSLDDDSASEILSSDGDAYKLGKYKDKIVIIAVTASGTTDIGVSPLAGECPLSRVHSNALNTMLTGRFIRSVPLFPFIIPAAVLLSICFAFIAARVRLFHAVLLLAAVGVFYMFFSFLMFTRASYEIPTSAPWLVFVLTASGSLIVQGIRTESEALHAAEALQRYLSPQMLDTIIKEGTEIDLSTRRKELTILFADIEGFSTISEIVDVEYLEKFLNEFFEAMTRSVFDHKGTVNKFLGDGLLAFFGDPVELENHALAAIKAANQMHKEMLRLNSLWSGTGIPEFDKGIHIRIGINTGMVVVGNIGSKQRMEYTVLGSAVNLASRLQGLATPDRTLITARTYALAKDKLKCSAARKESVRGLERGVTVYEVESVSEC